MTTYTHADLSAAIDKMKVAVKNMTLTTGWAYEAHLDTLAAILDLHQPTPVQSVCPWCVGYDARSVEWPCPTVRVVVDALTRMGAL